MPLGGWSLVSRLGPPLLSALVLGPRLPRSSPTRSSSPVAFTGRGRAALRAGGGGAEVVRVRITEAGRDALSAFVV